MVMPAGLSGVELTETLRRDDPALKVILFSGYSPELARKTGPIPENVVCLPKPCAPAEMARIVRRCLDSPTPTR
jgi:CheY-like chemotaxis protein